MTIAVCFSCGAMKFGALTPCEQCKVMPREEDDIILSLVMTDRHFPVSELENISRWLMEGNGPLNVAEETKEFYRPAARDAQRMLGLTSQLTASRKLVVPEGYKIPVPKSFWKKMRHYWLYGWRY